MSFKFIIHPDDGGAGDELRHYANILRRVPLSKRFAMRVAQSKLKDAIEWIRRLEKAKRFVAAHPTVWMFDEKAFNGYRIRPEYIVAKHPERYRLNPKTKRGYSTIPGTAINWKARRRALLEMRSAIYRAGG